MGSFVAGVGLGPSSPATVYAVLGGVVLFPGLGWWVYGPSWVWPLWSVVLGPFWSFGCFWPFGPLKMMQWVFVHHLKFPAMVGSGLALVFSPPMK